MAHAAARQLSRDRGTATNVLLSVGLCMWDKGLIMKKEGLTAHEYEHLKRSIEEFAKKAEEESHKYIEGFNKGRRNGWGIAQALVIYAKTNAANPGLLTEEEITEIKNTGHFPGCPYPENECTCDMKKVEKIRKKASKHG